MTTTLTFFVAVEVIGELIRHFSGSSDIRVASPGGLGLIGVQHLKDCNCLWFFKKKKKKKNKNKVLFFMVQ